MIAARLPGHQTNAGTTTPVRPPTVDKLPGSPQTVRIRIRSRVARVALPLKRVITRRSSVITPGPSTDNMCLTGLFFSAGFMQLIRLTGRNVSWPIGRSFTASLRLEATLCWLPLLRLLVWS